MCGSTYAVEKQYDVVIPTVGDREDAEKIADALRELTTYVVNVVPSASNED